MTDLRERVARAMYSTRPDYSVHTEEYPWHETKDWDAVPADWQNVYRSLADAALRIITEECAKVAEEVAAVYAADSDKAKASCAWPLSGVATRIRQIAGDK